jgi:hypothetical protein
MALFRRKAKDPPPPDTSTTTNPIFAHGSPPTPPFEEVAGKLRLTLIPAAAAPQFPQPFVNPLVAELVAMIQMGVNGRFVTPEDARRWGHNPNEIVAIAKNNLQGERVHLVLQEGPITVYELVGVDHPAAHLTRLHELMTFPPDGLLVSVPTESSLIIHPIGDAHAFMSAVLSLTQHREEMDKALAGSLLTRYLIWITDGGRASPISAEFVPNAEEGDPQLSIKVPTSFQPIYLRMLSELQGGQPG